MILFGALVAAGEVEPPSAPEHGTLQVEVVGLPGGAGTIRAALWRDGTGFPVRAEDAWRQVTAEMAGAESRVRFEGVPYGHWAISLYHDENGNEELDRNFLGIPTEAFGASNDRGSRLQAPEFEDATFRLDAPNKTLRVQLIRPF